MRRWPTTPGSPPSRRSGPSAGSIRSSELDFPLDPAATGIDDLLRLPGQVDRLRLTLARRPQGTASAHLSWDVTALTSPVRQGRHQARTTVPLLMAPLGVLGLVVLWMALTTAAEQRRPEVAVARLRGRGVRVLVRTCCVSC